MKELNDLTNNVDKLQMFNSGLDERKYFLLNNITNKQKIKPDTILKMKKHLMLADKKVKSRSLSIQKRRQTVNMEKLQNFQDMQKRHSKNHGKSGKNVKINLQRTRGRANYKHARSYSSKVTKLSLGLNSTGPRIIKKDENPFYENYRINNRKFNNFFAEDQHYLAESTNPVNTIYDLDTNQP